MQGLKRFSEEVGAGDAKLISKTGRLKKAHASVTDDVAGFDYFARHDNVYYKYYPKLCNRKYKHLSLHSWGFQRKFRLPTR